MRLAGSSTARRKAETLGAAQKLDGRCVGSFALFEEGWDLRKGDIRQHITGLDHLLLEGGVALISPMMSDRRCLMSSGVPAGTATPR